MKNLSQTMFSYTATLSPPMSVERDGHMPTLQKGMSSLERDGHGKPPWW